MPTTKFARLLVKQCMHSEHVGIFLDELIRNHGYGNQANNFRACLSTFQALPFVKDQFKHQRRLYVLLTACLTFMLPAVVATVISSGYNLILAGALAVALAPYIAVELGTSLAAHIFLERKVWSLSPASTLVKRTRVVVCLPTVIHGMHDVTSILNFLRRNYVVNKHEKTALVVLSDFRMRRSRIEQLSNIWH